MTPDYIVVQCVLSLNVYYHKYGIFFANVNLEAVASLCDNLFSCACFLFILVAYCDEKKYNISKSFFLHNCTYLTFDLTVTLNPKFMLGIHPYIVCNSLRDNSSLDAEHKQKMPSGVLVGIKGGRLICFYWVILICYGYGLDFFIQFVIIIFLSVGRYMYATSPFSENMWLVLTHSCTTIGSFVTFVWFTTGLDKQNI